MHRDAAQGHLLGSGPSLRRQAASVMVGGWPPSVECVIVQLLVVRRRMRDVPVCGSERRPMRCGSWLRYAGVMLSSGVCRAFADGRRYDTVEVGRPTSSRASSCNDAPTASEGALGENSATLHRQKFEPAAMSRVPHQPNQHFPLRLHHNTLSSRPSKSFIPGAMGLASQL